MKHFFTIFVLLLFFIVSSSLAQIDWTKQNGGSPVMVPGSPGTWEDDEVYAPCVIKDGDTLKMWYTGAKSTGIDQIGYATSTDGITWQKYAGNPVLRVGNPSSWDSKLVVHPEVIYDGSIYHMWYGGSSNPNWYDFDAGYATSPDGIHWTKYDDPTTTNAPYDQSDPVLRRGNSGEWDDATLAGATCIADGDTLRMWYGGCDGPDWANARIGYATSTNGIDWQKYTGNPVFDGGGAWGAVSGYVPFVFADTSGYKMWYQGVIGSHDKIGYATSTDGINWNPWSSPVLEPGGFGTWDNTWVGGNSVLFDNNLYYMWYSGATTTTGWRIGYATALPTALEEIDSQRYPEAFILDQNYPNPFNPRTTIEFQIPSSQFVTLKIYNLLGQEVTTLVSEKLNAGNYKYDWDAGTLPSGVYLYKLQVGKFQQIKKMILLK